MPLPQVAALTERLRGVLAELTVEEAAEIRPAVKARLTAALTTTTTAFNQVRRALAAVAEADSGLP